MKSIDNNNKKKNEKKWNQIEYKIKKNIENWFWCECKRVVIESN